MKLVFPGETWLPHEGGEFDQQLLEQARDYALTGGGSGMIIKGGRLVLSWGDQDKCHDLKSSTKSIGLTALGLAIEDGKVTLDDKAVDHHPDFGTKPALNLKTGWLPKITLRHLATQTAGFEKPGGFTKLLFEPGTKWDYSDSGPNWIAEILTLKYREDMRDFLFRRIFEPIGITLRDLTWRIHSYRPRSIDGIPRREFGAGISADVDSMARIGLHYLSEGKWGDQQLLPSDFVKLVRETPADVAALTEHKPGFGNASDHYGLLWWNNNDGALPDVPKDAFWSWGLHDSLIVVIPSLDLVVARAGRGWNRKGDWGLYNVLIPFLQPIAQSKISE
ncbi:MAG: CubicO group peptidase (beta-lactamase class C family) [Verrucomicrobiales bacterium]|jgi:CubicO group peptidase (beta-lactamase class C family)